VSDLSQVNLTDLDTFAGAFPHDIFRLHPAPGSGGGTDDPFVDEGPQVCPS
jgi:hypothetical protein